MDTLVLPPAGSGRRRRRFSPEFKAQIVAACRQPGVSIAAIALANQLNANLVRRWVGEHERLPALTSALCDAPPASTLAIESPTPAFVPLHVTSPTPLPSGEIHIELRRNGLVMTLSWPVAQAEACSAWLRDLLR